MDASSSWASRRVRSGALLLLACGVVGAAAIHRLSHGVRFGDAGSTWPLPPEARLGEWTRWAAVPMQAPILGVWGASPDNMWAWGRLDIIHWDGRAWLRVKRPDVDAGTIEEMGGSAEAVWVRVVHNGRGRPGPSGPRSDYWCNSGDGWTPGACPTTGRRAALTTPDNVNEAVNDVELEGLSLGRPVTFASFAPFPQLAFVRGHRVGGYQVWAIDSSGAFLGHFDGRRWTVGSTRNPLFDDLNGLWFASETDGWAIAGPTVLRWDGHEWTLAAKLSRRLRAIWGTGSDDVWVVGEAGVSMHWDGQSWTYGHLAQWTDLTVVAGSGSNDIWIGGCTLDSVVLLHREGWDWRRWDVPSHQFGDRSGVTCPLVASSGDRRVRALIEDRLRAVDASRPPAAGPSPERSFDVRLAHGEKITALVTAGAAEVWALGSRSDELRPDEPRPFAVHLTHSAPAQLRPLPGHGTIKAVWARGSDDVWAVGTKGLVLHFDGQSWTRLPVDSNETFVAVHGAGRTVWIAGDGTLLRRRL